MASSVHDIYEDAMEDDFEGNSEQTIGDASMEKHAPGMFEGKI